MQLHEFLESSANLYPDKIALTHRERRLTFAEIDATSTSFCNALVKEGFERHDRAIIYLDNSIESVISLFGILKAGGIFVIINPQTREGKLKHILFDCEPRIVITDSIHAVQVSETLGKIPNLSKIVLIDYDTHEAPYIPSIKNVRVLSYQAMIIENSNACARRRSIDVDLASLIYTSGSTGTPKGVMLTHLNMVSATGAIISYLENTREDILLNTLPLSFSYGLYQILTAFKFGGAVVLENTFVYPEVILQLILKEKVTGWPIVPAMAAILLRLKNLDKRDFPSLRYITSAGQYFPPRHIDGLKKVFPRVRIFSMYGLTECARVSYQTPDELANKPESVGKAIPNTEVYLVDAKDCTITEAGISGELVVRGSNIMLGYWKLAEETARALRPGLYPGEKVLHTGDIFKKDEEGNLYFLGRKDDIIKTSGHLVSPKEVEDVLYEMEDVIEAAVIGVEDEIKGRAIKAFVRLADNSKISEENILRFCHDHLEDYAVPRYITFCGPFPKTDNGKIQKQDLV